MSQAPPSVLPSTLDIITREWGEINEREVLEYSEETDTYWAQLDSTEPVYMQVLSAIATISGTRPTELLPLYTGIGEEGLEELASLEITEAVIGEVTLSLSYVDYEISVYSDGAIAVKPPC